MSGQGRPVRFLLLIGMGWVGMRVAMLWPRTGSLPAALEHVVPVAQAKKALPRLTRRPPLAATLRPYPIATQTRFRAPVAHVDAERVQLALLAMIRYGPANPFVPAAPIAAAVETPLRAPLPSERLSSLPNPWSASAWAVVRPGTGLGAAPGGSQLGGSQAGLVVHRMLDSRARLSAFGRVATPLRGKGAEAAIGLQWQPGTAPVRLVAEQRFGLDGSSGGPGLGLVGGADTRLPAGFRLESYGQAGAIRRRRTEPYADGAARATRAVADLDGHKLSLGAGMWGAAQRDGARLDLGPSATLSLPAGLRLSLDWRQRVAGGARPGSGLALTLGGDF